jgi:hypothetical protein
MSNTKYALDKDIFWQLIEISMALSSERNSARLFEKILDAAQDITHADGGTLYLLKEKNGQQVLEFEILRNNSLNLTLGGSSGRPIPFAPLPLHRADGSPNHNNIATYTALTKKMEISKTRIMPSILIFREQKPLMPALSTVLNHF